ncbi:Yos1-like protein, putative [Plasmodium malariae]|uniref:Yos1-like protein, putative n=1 Tax=Plasmodium malariae TaxID=5858 RepID=A0A1C3L1I7_PLAMA|nr:Yos1-like protein, putative [Plasmodium malariae]SBT80404.1 Yos1-like protein, putative [Plasmodium malariae]SCO94040.1 Yos1-like protein, putative [Plasmodium malariae]
MSMYFFLLFESVVLLINSVLIINEKKLKKYKKIDISLNSNDIFDNIKLLFYTIRIYFKIPLIFLNLLCIVVEILFG